MCAGGVEGSVCIAMGVRWGCWGVCAWVCAGGVEGSVHSYGCALGVLRGVCA